MIFIGLGSNLDNPAEQLSRAIGQLEQEGARVLRCSSFWHTPPWGVEEQPEFVNAVCELSWDGGPVSLMKKLLEIEERMGRIREVKWGPRIIDLDLLEFNGISHDTDFLKLPHPYYPQRDFVLVPLAELEPDWIPTGYKETVTALLEKLEPGSIVRLED